MDFTTFMQLVSQVGICGALLFLCLWYYHRYIRPAQEAKDAAIAALNASLIKDQIDENRRQREDAFAREKEIRKEHSEAWEAMRQQHKEERAEDLHAQERMIERIGAALDANTAANVEGHNRNTGLILALGTQHGTPRKELRLKAEEIIDKPIDPRYDTNHGGSK